MARTVRDYLAGTFGIDSDRIAIQGAARPPHASGTRATPREDLPLVEEENLRVEVAAAGDEPMKGDRYPILFEIDRLYYSIPENFSRGT